MKIVYHLLVQKDVQDAVGFYNEQRAGLGDEFFDQVLLTVSKIRANPEQNGFWLNSRSVRRKHLRRFPFAVLFEVLPLKIKVICLRHDKRSPAFGLRRR